MANAYIFYGKAGSGKGTQAEMLEQYITSQGTEVVMVGQGAAFRAFAKDEGYVQNLTRETLDSGKLMPAFMPIYLWSKKLVENFTGTQDIVVEGVARVLEEANILSKALQYLKFEHVYVFHVHISDATAIDRIKSRAALDGDKARADDLSDASIQTRLDAYKHQVMPIVEYFMKNPTNTFVEINGELDIEGVFDQIKEAIK
jgi:adenylate kinase family enzyme